MARGYGEKKGDEKDKRKRREEKSQDASSLVGVEWFVNSIKISVLVSIEHHVCTWFFKNVNMQG
jgi:hypothetical protein